MAEYSKLPQAEGLLPEPNTHSSSKSRRLHRSGGVLLFFLILSTCVSIALNIALATQVWSESSSAVEESPPHGRYAKSKHLETVWSRFYWHSRWDSANRTASDELWDRIKPSHGFVAIDREQAAKDGWPEAMYLPSDHSKGVYLIEAYHQLHCLKIVRQTFYQALDGRNFTYDPHHAEHCFDALRQSTVCNADSTPLYTFGDMTAGDGQIHKCRNWEQLRDWTGQNSACYKDSVKDIPLGDHFGFCDDGEDGIPAWESNIDS